MPLFMPTAPSSSVSMMAEVPMTMHSAERSRSSQRCAACAVNCPVGACVQDEALNAFTACDLCGGDPLCVRVCLSGALRLEDDAQTSSDLRSNYAAKMFEGAPGAQEDLTDGGIDLIGALVKAELVASRSEGRRAIEQGGVSVDGEKITDIKYVLAKDELSGEGVVIKRGKKKFKKVCMK